MKLAEGKPLPRRLMAAMAQQDCGQCGYNCKDYADALFVKKEERLNLCVPGGKETARMLKNLYAELGAAPARSRGLYRRRPLRHRRPAARATIRFPPHFSRAGVSTNQAREKETWHIEFDLAECGLDYAVGDSFGIFPPTILRWSMRLLVRLRRRRIFRSAGEHCARSLPTAYRCRLRRICCSSSFPISPAASGRKKPRRLPKGRIPMAMRPRSMCWRRCKSFRAFGQTRKPSSSPSTCCSRASIRFPRRSSAIPGRVSLTVDAVRYDVEKRTRLGVASTFLAGRVSPGDKIRVYVQKAQHFALPADPNVPIIMIGPGTGVAPFRAFLQERIATKAPGRNWLYFGHQRSDYDFFYKDEFVAHALGGPSQSPDACLVARQRRENLRPAPHAR